MAPLLFQRDVIQLDHFHRNRKEKKNSICFYKRLDLKTEL